MIESVEEDVIIQDVILKIEDYDVVEEKFLLYKYIAFDIDVKFIFVNSRVSKIRPFFVIAFIAC